MEEGEKVVFYFSYPMTVVEIRTCKQTGKEFSVMQHELDVLEQISPVV
jgi:hypothetical protein